MNKARMVEELAAMGFPAGQAERALVAAFYNRDRAVDYLLNGIPEADAPDDNTSTRTAVGSNQPAGGEVLYLDAQQMAQLQQLVDTPEFENIRRHAAQNPQVLQDLKGFLQQHRPELFRLFEQNPGLCEALVAGQPQIHVEGGDEAGAGELPEPGAAGEAPAPQLGPEDRAAIAAMQAFGFSEQQCVEAYLICDRNQELALNYLLDEQANR